MQTQQPLPSLKQSRRQRRTFRALSRRHVLIAVLLLITCIIIVLVTFSTIGLLSPAIAAIISTSAGVLGALFALWPLLFSSAASAAPAVGPPNPSDALRVRGINGLPPPVDARTIQQREPLVSAVSSLLLQADTTCVVLTGLGGVGKSTLAALVARSLETQRRAGRTVFSAAPLWLTLDASVTLPDLAGTLCAALEQPAPDVQTLSPQSLAAALFQALATAKRARLVILDQFDSLLDAQSGSALANRPGVGEWLDALNSQPSRCRILLTSRLLPQGAHAFPPTYLHAYEIGGLTSMEGKDLLQRLGVGASTAELEEAVRRCEGHPLALTLLAALLARNHSLTLALLLRDSLYTRFWSGDIAHNLLDYIYKEQLNPLQRRLLLAFSVYREAVPLPAVQVVLSEYATLSTAQIVLALETLLAHYLLQAAGHARFHLHPLVADYARDHFDEQSEAANLHARQLAHARAAHYYLREASTHGVPLKQRRQKSDVHDLIEAVWQYGQAEQWRDAYEVMRREQLFADLRRWGANDVLLELSMLLLPLEKWQPARAEAAYLSNHLGRLSDDLGRTQEALAFYEQTLTLSRELGDGTREGVALNNMGRLFRTLGRNAEAQHSFEQALQASRAAADRGGEGTTLNNLAALLVAQGKTQEAQPLLEQALELFRTQAPYPAGEARALNTLGQLLTQTSQPEQAQHAYQQALLLYRQVGDRRGEVRALHSLGNIAASQDQYEQARDLLEQALTLSTTLAHRRSEVTIQRDLAQVFAGHQEWQAALTHDRDALRLVRAEQDHTTEAQILLHMSTLYEQQQRDDAALACLLLAQHTLPTTSAEQSTVQRRREEMQKKLGDEAFAALLTRVEAQAEHIVAQA